MMVLLIVTATSMLLAAIMSVAAWRIAGGERRRSDARVAALAAAIHGAEDPDVGRVEQDPARGNLLSAPPSRSASRPLAIIGAGALVFGAVVAIAIVTGRGVSHAPAAPAAPPLELVALGHERVGDQLTVRGVIRNPAAGAGMDGLSAVVLVFTPDGGFVASGRAPVEAAALRPGAESTFMVTLPRAADVARYRVSFRAGDRLVAHLDRRHAS